MNSEARTSKLQNIQENHKPLYQDNVQWRGEMKLMDVYEIPLEDLIYNKYNGRILSRTKSLESQQIKVDPETPEGRKKIADLLWFSKPDRNSKTQNDLRKYGQKKAGIVTKDGVIVDGNRRAMLLSKIDHPYFRAVILDVKIGDDPKEIETLETIYQMGEDAKVDYNPIEKYLKVDTMLNKEFKKDEIAYCMNITPKQVSDLHEVYETMVGYLDYLGYSGMFTQLDGREDQFITLTAWLKKFRDSESSSGFEGYNSTDVDDLETISYDYIRYKYEGKDFRKIAEGQKGSHFFSKEDIWQRFKQNHFDKVDPISEAEEAVDTSSPNLTATLNARDNAWKDKVDGVLKENWHRRSYELELTKDAKKPAALLDRALSALNGIDPDNEHFEGDEVLDKVKEINKICYELKKALGA